MLYKLSPCIPCFINFLHPFQPPHLAPHLQPVSGVLRKQEVLHHWPQNCTLDYTSNIWHSAMVWCSLRWKILILKKFLSPVAWEFVLYWEHRALLHCVVFIEMENSSFWEIYLSLTILEIALLTTFDADCDENLWVWWKQGIILWMCPANESRCYNVT